MTLRRSLGLLALLPFALLACANDGGAGDGAGHEPDDLIGVVWLLDPSVIASMGGGPNSGALVTLEFADGQVSGTAACNHYSGPYEARIDGSLSFGSFAVTEMECEEPLMTIESAFLDALSHVSGFDVDDRLVLTGTGHRLKFEREAPLEPLPLVGTTWTLTTIGSGDTVSSTIAGTDTTAELAPDGTITGKADCNRYHGTYTESGGAMLSFSALASTKMICSEDVMGQGSAFLAAMEKVAAYEIEGTQLSLMDASGALLLGFDGA